MSVSVCVRVFYSMHMMYLNLFSVYALLFEQNLKLIPASHSIQWTGFNQHSALSPRYSKKNMDLSSARPESAASGGRMGHHPGESSFPCLARKKFGRINYIYTHVIKTIWVCVLSCVYERTYVFNIQVINVHFMCVFIYIYMCVCMPLCVLFRYTNGNLEQSGYISCACTIPQGSAWKATAPSLQIM